MILDKEELEIHLIAQHFFRAMLKKACYSKYFRLKRQSLKPNQARESKFERMTLISRAVASLIFLTVACFTDESKTILRLNGLVGQRTKTTGQRSF